MKSVKIATLVAMFAVVLLLINHKLTTAWVTRLGAGNVGVSLPASVVFLVKLDHFFVDYFYVLIPFVWIATFLPCLLIEISLWMMKPSKNPEDGPIDS